MQGQGFQARNLCPMAGGASVTTGGGCGAVETPGRGITPPMADQGEKVRRKAILQSQPDDKRLTVREN
jgi:hypothetical protein